MQRTLPRRSVASRSATGEEVEARAPKGIGTGECEVEQAMRALRHADEHELQHDLMPAAERAWIAQ